jgi:3-methyladenine DNA glycosylase AlkC
MKDDFSEYETKVAGEIIADLRIGSAEGAIEKLRTLVEDMHADIPEKQRISRGITWVVQRCGELLCRQCSQQREVQDCARMLWEQIEKEDRLSGVPIYMMGRYGMDHFEAVMDFFEEAADADDWVVREFAQGAFRMVIKPNREAALAWLKEVAKSESPRKRRLAAETLRPVTVNRWMQDETDYPLSVLRLLFGEAHPYPRTSVGNNLSDLSRHNPDLVLELVEELVESGDSNSYWIAYRACRNLVKKYPQRVMKLLRTEEYHYKDRHFYLDRHSGGN